LRIKNVHNLFKLILFWRKGRNFEVMLCLKRILQEVWSVHSFVTRLVLKVLPILIKNKAGMINDQTVSQISSKFLSNAMKIAVSISNVTVYKNYFCCAYNKRVQRLKKVQRKREISCKKTKTKTKKFFMMHEGCILLGL